MKRRSSAWAATVALVAAACEPAPLPSSAGAPRASQAARAELPAATFPAPRRLVAIGDVHGDLDATRRALRLAGAVDAAGAWVGGDLFVVQVGDQLDRGDDDKAILDWFERLEEEARAKGGRFVALNGNHEIMNAQLDFRYVTPGSNPPFAALASAAPRGVPEVPEPLRGRAAAFFPGGAYAKKLAKQPLVAIVGDTVFVHAGLLPKHVAYGLERMDAETRAWLRGERPEPPKIVVAEDGPIWTRVYSAAAGKDDCATLEQVLGALGKKRLVMGHTPQKPDANATCGGKAWRIDTGLSRYYGGKIQALEIVGEEARLLTEGAAL